MPPRIAVALLFSVATCVAFAGEREGIPECPVIIAGANVFIDYRGSSSACSEFGDWCVSGESISFRALTFQYSFACSTHTFAWDFGDATTSSEMNPTHAFKDDAVYEVRLRVTSPSQSATIVQKLIVQSGERPYPRTWDFVVQPLIFDHVVVENAFFFSAVTDFDASLVRTWQWDFGDGSSANGNAMQTHIYADNALHTVTLSVAGQPGAVRHVVGSAKRRAARH